jgi:hypothetical protein
MEPVGTGMTMIKADVPMAEMLTYSQSLTSMTGGRGDYHMAFARYEEVRLTSRRRSSRSQRRRKKEVEGLGAEQRWTGAAAANLSGPLRSPARSRVRPRFLEPLDEVGDVGELLLRSRWYSSTALENRSGRTQADADVADGNRVLSSVVHGHPFLCS